GCCYDNACVESFFHSLKVECIHGEHFISREIMRATVFNYIECDYNRWRRRSWCGGLSPERFENKNLASACVHITWVGAIYVVCCNEFYQPSDRAHHCSYNPAS